MYSEHNHDALFESLRHARVFVATGDLVFELYVTVTAKDGENADIGGTLVTRRRGHVRHLVARSQRDQYGSELLFLSFTEPPCRPTENFRQHPLRPVVHCNKILAHSLHRFNRIRQNIGKSTTSAVLASPQRHKPSKLLALCSKNVAEFKKA